MLLLARNAIYTALAGASLPLSPTLEKKWFTTRQAAATTGAPALSSTPLISVVPFSLWGSRASRSSFHTGAAIAVVVRALCESEARADQLADFVEDVIVAARSAVTLPALHEVEIADFVNLELLNTKKVWLSEIHCLIGTPKGDA